MIDTKVIVTTNFQKHYYHLQFGNQMFLYCACRYYANLMNCEFSFPKNWEGSKIIDCDLGIDRTGEETIILSGYFQDIKYINKEWFKLKNVIIHERYQKYNLNNWCIIHFRGTDWLGKPYTINKHYYTYAKNKMLSINKNLQFLVVTDDIPSAKTFVEADRYESYSREEDFKLLALSKYIITSQSTFSWWASYLNTNKIYCISPSGWREPFDKLLESPHIDYYI